MDSQTTGLVLLGLTLAGLALVPGAQAHANLVGADPNPNSRVDPAPDRLELRFSEPLEDTYTRVQVAGPNGSDHVASSRIHEPGRQTITAELTELSDGLYSVRWRTLSAADGHTKAGSYLLGVNASLVPQAGDTGSNTSRNASNATGSVQAVHPGWGEALTRGLAFFAASLAAGLPIVLLTLPEGALTQRPTQRLTATASLAGGLGALAAIGLVALLAERIGTGFSTALATQNGSRQLLRALALTVAAGTIAPALFVDQERRKGALLGAGALAAVLGLVATALGGHAAAVETSQGLAVAMDVLHQAAVAFWIGGVVVLAWASLDPECPVASLGRVVDRLSPAFVVAVVVIVLTGSYASWIHLPSVAALWASGYGQALALKVLLLLPLIGLGAYHRYVLSPRLSGPEAKTHRGRLRRTIGAELLLMVLVLGAAGALTNTAPPANTSLAGPGPSLNATETNDTEVEPELGVLVHDANDSGFRFQMATRPDPVTVGGQNLSVRVTPEDTFPENATVILNLKPPSDPYGEGETIELRRWTNRTWTTQGPIFTEEGTWRLLLALQGKGTYASTSFELEVERS